MTSKKNSLKKIIKFTISCLFVIYITLYISQISGYYEYQLSEKKQLTEEQIKKFEEDVKSGVEVDLTEYLTTDDHYQNKFSNMGMNFSLLISKYTDKCVEGFFNFIGNLASE